MGEMYILSEFGMILIPLANVVVMAGDKLRVYCRYSHRGKAESQPLYVAIGNDGWAGFNEILHASKTLSVPEDSSWQTRDDYVDISITTGISKGVYDLYAKIGGATPKVISPILTDVVEVTQIGNSEFGEIMINSYSKV
ncbi:MAG: hypothetical protein JW712_08050 [Dehalococcoidales bacterium]|nr:hypothetical protein [Dehalococcoidales bacterium]